MTTYFPRQWACAFALLAGICFTGCFFWNTLPFMRDPELAKLHMDMLRMSYFAFSGMNPTSFISGLVQSVLWGAIAGWAIATSLNLFAQKS